MSELFIDATVPLRWGPHPPVGIPRVEFAIVRQALRQKSGKVAFFKVERNGESRLLDKREARYLEDLVEGRFRNIEAGARESFLARLQLVVRSIRSGAAISGKEFDRVSASFLSGRSDRRGASYQVAKAFIRLMKLCRLSTSGRNDNADPLADADATCFLSTAGLHHIASGQRSGRIKARISTVLHDLIPIDYPKLVDRSHAKNFRCDVDWMFANCQQLICVSKHTAEQARIHGEARSIASPLAISVAQLGSFLKEGARGRDPEPVLSLAGQRYALYCSTIEIRKNHILLLKVWAHLLSDLGARLPKIVFCGRWGWMYDEVKAFLASHPELDDRVVFLSDVSDQQLVWLYRNAEFGLYPSLAEGWGLGAAESLDFGLPVLISEVPSLGEATQGLMPVIPAADFDGWCEAVVRASTDPAWLSSLRDDIRSHYRPIQEVIFATRLLSLVAGKPGRLSVPDGSDLPIVLAEHRPTVVRTKVDASHGAQRRLTGESRSMAL